MLKKSIAAQRPFKLALIASIAMLAASVSAPSLAASTSASAAATVMVPIAISKTTDLSFGKFAVGSTGGTLLLNTSGTLTPSADITPGGGTPAAAVFHITGETGAAYGITSPDITLSDGASHTMGLALVSGLATGVSSGTVTTSNIAAGGQDLYVGGTLTVGASQTPGSYTGTVAVSVAYQ